MGGGIPLLSPFLFVCCLPSLPCRPLKPSWVSGGALQAPAVDKGGARSRNAYIMHSEMIIGLYLVNFFHGKNLLYAGGENVARIAYMAPNGSAAVRPCRT